VATMQSKHEQPSLISNVASTALCAERAVMNITRSAKHLFFPTADESRVSFIDRTQVELKQKGFEIANDLTSIVPRK